MGTQSVASGRHSHMVRSQDSGHDAGRAEDVVRVGAAARAAASAAHAFVDAGGSLAGSPASIGGWAEVLEAGWHNPAGAETYGPGQDQDYQGTVASPGAGANLDASQVALRNLRSSPGDTVAAAGVAGLDAAAA